MSVCASRHKFSNHQQQKVASDSTAKLKLFFRLTTLFVKKNK
jgi:hypothetical protein